MRLSKTTNDAVKILVACAQSDTELIKVAQIAERLQLTEQNTFKIVHMLSRAKFLKAVRGRYGGVKLAQPAQETLVGEVVRSIEAMASAARHSSGMAGKRLDEMFDTAFEAFIDVLNSSSIADMAKTAGKGGVGSGQASRSGKEDKSDVPMAVKTTVRKRSAGLQSSQRAR
ncbi:MAG: Rrf2 family transcriptional regulator [Pseudomonadota bacterium]